MTDSSPLSWSALTGSLSLPKSISKPVRVRRIPQPPAIPLELLAGGNSGNGQVSEDAEELERVLLQAPPWLVSTVLHMSALILMGITWYAIEQQASPPPAALVMLPPPELPAIQPGSGGGEESGDGFKDGFENGDNRPFAPPDVTQEGFQEFSTSIELGPLSPPAVELAPDGLMRASSSRGPKLGDGMLSGRGPRKGVLDKIGGSPATIKGVNEALAWFKRNQRTDGLWSLRGPYADGAYTEDFPAATALALLAFQGDGHTHVDGEYQDVVKRGWKSLLKLQAPSGQFVGAGAPSQHQLYAHAQCTIAICELHGMSHDSAYRRAAERAIAFCIQAQDQKLGGWRYEPAMDSDLSVTGWFLMALQSARMAGLEVPPEVFVKASKFLDLVQAAEGSQYTYVVNDRPSLSMTAEGLLSRQYLGWKRDDVRLVQGANLLASNLISMNAGERDVYYWYYATQVMHHMGGDHWRRWNDVMKVEVPKMQVKDGREKGSWDPAAYRWGDSGGRLFITALQTYMLQVYHRHMPLYREIGGRGN